MHKPIAQLAIVAVLLLGGMGASVQQSPAATALTYDVETQGPAPIPPSERTLRTAAAESWFKVSDENHVLEGAIFDSDGNLLVCDVTDRCVVRLTPERQRSTVIRMEDFAPGGLAFHKEGRLFIAALNLEKGLGTIVAVKPDGTEMETIIPPNAGYLPNDLVFDDQGGFYFTDFKGMATNPEGGVYYTSPDFRTITPVLPHLAMANGVALSPDGKTLWATVNLPTQRTSPQSDHPFPTTSSVRLLIPCERTPTATCMSRCTGKVASWFSTKTAFPSDRSCFRAGNRERICSLPAWPSVLVGGSFMPLPAMRRARKGQRFFMPMHSATVCRLSL